MVLVPFAPAVVIVVVVNVSAVVRSLCALLYGPGQACVVLVVVPVVPVALVVLVLLSSVSVARVRGGRKRCMMGSVRSSSVRGPGLLMMLPLLGLVPLVVGLVVVVMMVRFPSFLFHFRVSNLR